MHDVIRIDVAYLAMYSFLEELYSKYQYEQIGGVLGGMSLLGDGSTADPAIWDDWLRSVERAKAKQVDANLRIVAGA